MLRFEWVTPPDAVFPEGMDRYGKLVMDALYTVMVEEAPMVQQFMRENAPWHDSCMPGREYLLAVPFRDDMNWKVGIVAYYDLAVYRAKCPEPKENWAIAHETYTFKHAGVISIILPRRPNTVLGDEAPRIWDRVRALFEPGYVPDWMRELEF